MKTVSAERTVKICCAISGLFLVAISNASATLWQEITANAPGMLSPDYRMPLTSDGVRLYAAGATGVYVSSNSGDTFSAVNSLPGAEYDLSDFQPRLLKFVNGNVWVSFGGFPEKVNIIPHMLYRLSPGGTEWQTSGSGIPVGSSVEDLAYDASTQSYYAVVSTGSVYVSTDGGSNWEARTNGLGGIGSPASMVAGNGAALTARPLGGVLRTVDQGGIWNQSLNIGNRSPGSLILHQERLIMSADRSIFYSDDWGASWLEVTNVPHGASMLSSDGNNIFAVSRQFTAPEALAVSTNHGITWELLPKDGIPERGVFDIAGYYVQNLFRHGEYLFLRGQTLNTSFLPVDNHLHRVATDQILEESFLLEGGVDLGGGWFEQPWLSAFQPIDSQHAFHADYGWFYSTSGSLTANGAMLYFITTQSWHWFSFQLHGNISYKPADNAWFAWDGQQWIRLD